MRKLVFLGSLMLALPVSAEIDGHGPDAWQVTGVAADDVLNMRMGPGTEYPVIDRLAPDARGLQQVTCVPLLIQPYAGAISEAERAKLPQRWCLMRSADLAQSGWVAQRFLAEDSGGQMTEPPASDPGDNDLISPTAAEFMQGYQSISSGDILERVGVGLEDTGSVFLPHGQVSPLALAILALEADEGVRDRVRFRISWGVELHPNPPKAYPLVLSFIQVDRISLGEGIRADAVASYGAENVAPPEEFDVGPHVSWRMVSSPVMGMRADIHAIGKREIPASEAADMTCFDKPCLEPVMLVDEVAGWGEMTEQHPDLDMPYAAIRGDLLSPAAMIDLLAEPVDSSESISNPEGKPETDGPPAPFLEAIIDVNLATDSVIDAAVRIGGLLDDSIAAEWKRVVAMPGNSPGTTLKTYGTEAYECHRGGSKFPPEGEYCP